MEVWLKPNRRALAMGMILPLAMALLGLGAVIGFWPPSGPLRVFIVAAGTLMAGLGGLSVVLLGLALRQPRIAFDGSSLWFHIDGRSPVRVPLEAVEAFLGGRSESLASHARIQKTYAVVVRFADRFPEFHERPIRHVMGTWQDGYLSIRGLWCEPISAELIKSLNRKLNEAKRRTRQAPEGDTAAHSGESVTG